jgi:EAL domain-containing protein (putative c-di-GMP-specific phosphodiesterase class I)
VADVLTRLRMKNIQLSIDDFSTGYAMKQPLVNIPANELKIDRVFIENMHTNSSDCVMVESHPRTATRLGRSSREILSPASVNASANS